MPMLLESEISTTSHSTRFLNYFGFDYVHRTIDVWVEAIDRPPR